MCQLPSISTSHQNTTVVQTACGPGSSTVRTIASDGAGNIVTDQGSTIYNYWYNNRGRLSQLTVGSTATANYSYDGLEQMAVRTMQNMTPSGTTYYIYDRAVGCWWKPPVLGSNGVCRAVREVETMVAIGENPPPIVDPADSGDLLR